MPNKHIKEYELYPEEKNKIKSTFISLIEKHLKNDDFLHEAFNARESITRNNAVCKNFKDKREVFAALESIANKNGEYAVFDKARLGSLLSSMGCAKELKDRLNEVEILKYEAIVYYAHNLILEQVGDLYNHHFDEGVSLAEQELYLADCKEFTNDIYLIAGAIIILHISTRSALDELKNVLPVDDSNITALEAAGFNVLQTTSNAYKNGEVSVENMPKIIKFIKGATELLKDHSNISKFHAHQKNTVDVLGISRQWGKLFAGAILSFLGVAIIGFSIALAVGTFGGATPLSAAGLALGANIVASGVAIGLSLSAGLGLASSAGILAIRATNGSIVIAGEQLKTEYLKQKNNAAVGGALLKNHLNSEEGKEGGNKEHTGNNIAKKQQEGCSSNNEHNDGIVSQVGASNYRK